MIEQWEVYAIKAREPKEYPVEHAMACFWSPSSFIYAATGLGDTVGNFEVCMRHWNKDMEWKYVMKLVSTLH